MQTHLIRVLIFSGLGLASSVAAASPERVIYSFPGGTSGAIPEAAVIADSSGALYGTTFAGGTASVGTIYKLTPPAAGHTAWSHAVL